MDTQNKIYDPRQAGPFDRCIRCFTPYNNARAYCSMCGKISTVFSTKVEISGEVCAIHKNSKAIAYCCICNQPICDNCKERKQFSFPAGLIDIYYCKKCTVESKKIEENFFETLVTAKKCAKHHDEISTSKCLICKLPLCAYCSYFITGIIFRWRIKSGPYCLSCYRSEKIKKSGGLKFGYQLNKQNLTKQST